MSHKVSNLFASRVYSEHPLALWALDDELYFTSLVSQANKNIELWTLTNSQIAASASYASETPMPDEDSPVLVPISGSTGYMEFLGPEINVANSLDTEKDTLCITTNVYAYSSFTESYEIGFKYYNASASAYFYDTQEFTSGGENFWEKIIHTMDIGSASVIYPYIKVNSAVGTISDSYNVRFNGTSIGQWSELFHNDSTGVTPVTLTDSTLNSLLPTSSPLGIKVIEADSYGLLDNKNGYYIVDNNKMLATNTSMPLVFGSSNVTEIHKPVSADMPSIVMPGQGFLNKLGQYSDLTAEFWLRVYTKSSNPIRIFGPLSSDDGLYVEEEFLTLRVGKYTKSYFVGKWYRPMLIDIRYTQTIVSLLVNGDVVFSLDIDPSEISFPRTNYDWLGFFGHEDVHPFEIDSVSIYPYIVPDQLAKKRYVYAQGVVGTENIVNNFNGESIYIDFPFANYSSTMNYPDMTGWNAGFFNNINATSKYLSFPNYSLPEINFIGDDLDVFILSVDPRTWLEATERDWIDWTSLTWGEFRTESAADVLEDSFIIQEGEYPFISLKPNSIYEDVYGSIYFSSINPIDNPVKSIFGMFRTPNALPETEEVVMQFNSKTNSNLFKITISDEGLKYIYNDITLITKAISASTDFTAGIELNRLTTEYFSTISNFFSNPQNISLSLGGYEKATFSGRIYGLTFNNELFTNKDLLDYISDAGIFGFTESFDADRGADTYLIEYIGNYTYHPILTETSLIVDIGCSGYWEDSLPLSYFGKFINNSNQQSYYDLDMIQFNVNNPSPLIVNGTSTQTDGEDLRINTYLTIQDYSQVGKVPYTDYTNTQIIGANRVLDIDKYTYNDIQSTKFEIVDGTVIFPPKELVDFEDYYITTHIEMKTTGINSRIVQLQKMSYSSLAFDESNFFSINTKTGNKIYPFSRYDNAYAYKDKNPFSIYKDSSPYMYLTGDSGITVLPHETTATRGLSIPINEQQTSEYLLGGIQLWSFYNKSSTIDETIKVGRIKTANYVYDLYLIPETGNKRGTLKLYDAESGIEVVETIFYQNGSIVTNPIIYPQSWSSILISFGQSIVLDGQIGQLELYEGFLFNNIAFFQKSSDILGIRQISRDWNDVRATIVDIPGPVDPSIDNLWSLWDNSTWAEIEQVEEIQTFTINGEDLYQSYFGLSKAILDDDTTLLINSDSYRVITNVTWSEYSGRPV
jgi:hypothetical protein